MFKFDIQARDGKARAGTFRTPHGDLKTPVFAPVGTQATVKGVTPRQLQEAGATLVLANTYHLYLRPGDELIASLGGLHEFMQWEAPLLTDSGGFQVFSLAEIRQIDEDGVTFRSHVDGSMHRFTPEKAIQIQENLGADIIMAFDECAPPYDLAYSQEAIRRTHNWAERCARARVRSDQALFGIVQGGVFPDLRKRSAEVITGMNFHGNAIGGLSVGETKQEMHAMIEIVNEILPKDKPRYLMGVGTPDDLVQGVARGIDIFDCVLPTRLARHKAAFTANGRLNLTNAAYSSDPKPIEETCECYTCQHFSRAYIRHLILAKEMLAATLVSIHNIHLLVKLMENIRRAIKAGEYQQFVEQFERQNKAPNEEVGLI